MVCLSQQCIHYELFFFLLGLLAKKRLYLDVNEFFVNLVIYFMFSLHFIRAKNASYVHISMDLVGQWIYTVHRAKQAGKAMSPGNTFVASKVSHKNLLWGWRRSNNNIDKNSFHNGTFFNTYVHCNNQATTQYYLNIT